LKLALLIIPLFLSLFWNTGLAEEQAFVFVDQQVQIVADLTNSQDRIQNFAYIVQIKDDDVTVSLAWITGSQYSNFQIFSLFFIAGVLFISRGYSIL